MSSKKSHSTKDNCDQPVSKSLLELEDLCSRLIEAKLASDKDTEKMVWQQRFRNILTNISLALGEAEGVRRFHFHYRHDQKDSKNMLPVLEHPLSLLAHSCENALHECATKLSDTHDEIMISARRKLELALGKFLSNYHQLDLSKV